MLFQGAIDLLAVGEDEILIIDYKYSQKNAEYLRGHYARQLDLYRKAVAKIMQVDIRAVQCKIVNIFYCFQVDLE
jgi:ATP-dependent exoDNAse (exonuclease V) beta subunit